MKTIFCYRHITSILILFLLIVWSCKKDTREDPVDQELYEMAKSTDGFTWYKFSGSLLNRSSASGHSQPFLRTRFNSAASAKLNAEGKVNQGIVFPEGSLIVKELHDAGGLVRYAILYKNQDNVYADSKGWVWGYINSDGSVSESAANEGKSCISCHSQTGNIDYSLMNIYFP